MAKLLPVIAAVFTSFLLVGLALPVLPLHLHQGLGFGPFTVGLVTGSQFIASLLSRVWAGSFADTRGGKRAVVIGLVASACAGLIYLASLAVVTQPTISAAALLFGRAAVGLGESFIITGAVTWGLAISGGNHSGKVIAWIGTAMFAALALGAPLGSTLYGGGGFAAIALATTLLPVAILLAVLPIGGAGPAGSSTALPFASMLGAVWLPGLGAALSSIGYGAILSFGTLYFAQQNWLPVWLAFSAYAGALIAARLALGHLPDQLGGARIAAIFVLVEGAGLLLIWSATGPVTATIGAGLTGLGYSLVYPGLGVEVVRKLPPESRGLAMGLYTVFLDVALGFGSVVLGVIATWSTLRGVFLASAIIVLSAALVALALARRSVPQIAATSSRTPRRPAVAVCEVNDGQE